MKIKAKKQYTLNYILKSSLNTEKVGASKAALSENIEKAEGSVISSICSDTPKQFAYIINKETQGYFCECVFEISPKSVKDIKESLLSDGDVVRHMIESKLSIVVKPRKRTRKPKPMQILPRREEQPSLGGTLEKTEKREKVSMKDIEKKLDEIIENI